MRNDFDTEEFRTLLEKERDALIGRRDVQKEAAGTVELDQSRVGRLSRMDALQQQAMTKAAGQRSEDELRRIEAALVRISTGEYGCCLKCGEDIAEKRLRANPAAIHCLTCARMTE